MNVKFISVTQPNIEGLSNPEDLVAYCARVSNPSNQINTETAPKLLKFLIKHKHWSPLEMVDMTLEIKTSRAIAAQILRHKSFLEKSSITIFVADAITSSRGFSSFIPCVK